MIGQVRGRQDREERDVLKEVENVNKAMRVCMLPLLFVAACDPKPSEPIPAAPSSRPDGDRSNVSASGSADANGATATTATANDRETLLQKTLEIDALAPYWHDKTTAFTIASSEVVVDRPRLTMFGAPVSYVGAPDAAAAGRRGACSSTKEPSLCSFRFTKLMISEPRAAVDFVYPREGLSGHVDFERRPEGWVVARRSVAEQ